MIPISIQVIHMKGGGDIMDEIVRIFSHNNLHDFLLKNIVVDYISSSIFLNLIDCARTEKEIVISDFESITINNKSPWGLGAYIVSSDATYNNKSITFEFQLNSGDICTIICS